MKLSKAVKPISYIKSHASKVIRDLEDSGDTVVITLNVEAKAIMQDIRQYEKTQESLALPKILALGKKEVEERKIQPADDYSDYTKKLVQGSENDP